MVLVSVIVPVYNGEQYLDQCLRSVQSQTFGDYELIVVNDGSTDSTPRIIKDWSSLITLNVNHIRNQGLSNALNSGLLHAKGDYFATLDSDDTWLSHKLEMEHGVLARTKADVAYSDFILVRENGRRLSVRAPEAVDVNRLMKECFISMGSSMISTKAAQHLGHPIFDPKLSSAMDWDFWIRLSKFARFVHVPSIVSVYRRHPKQMSRGLSHRIEELRVHTRYNGFTLSYFYSNLIWPYMTRLRNKLQV
jgi:glycosyltransferase involved in cell wall biosynthesis